MLYPTYALSLVLIISAVQGADESIILDLQSIPVLGTPGTMSVWGEHAFPVIVGKNMAHPIAVAAEYGTGRFFAIAHGAYVAGVLEGNPTPLMQQVIWWVGQIEKPRLGVVNNDPAKWQDADVLMWGQNMQLTPRNEQRLLAWIERGGGVIASACPWGWAQVTNKDLHTELSQNRVMAELGMQYGGGYSESTGEGVFRIQAIPEETHAGYALDVIRNTGTCSPIGGEALLYAIQTIPPSQDSFVSTIKQVIEETPFNPPTSESPMSTDDVRGRLLVSLFSSQWKQQDVEEIIAARGSEIFPGIAPKEIQRVDHALVQLDATIQGWQSTGLYLSASDIMVIQTEDSTHGWMVQIGCHTDQLWHKKSWQRWPDISHKLQLSQNTRVATPWGGLVYFLATGGAEDISVSITGAVKAPFFDVAQTEIDWKKIRMNPAPWAELKGKHMIVSVPSDSIRALEHPEEVTAFWDEVVRSHCELAGIAVPRRPERFVADQQISAGYMHSGYPVMTWLDVATPKRESLAPVIDVMQLRKQGSWGHFHELGHNRQRSWWTFSGTGEVTCNLFSLHAGDVLCNIEPWENPWLKGQIAPAKEYLERGSDFTAWKQNPGIALVSYAQLQKAFGWEPFTAAFKVYESMDKASRPQHNQGKIDTWVRLMSQMTRHDLRTFYTFWGVPLSKELLEDATLGRLQTWLPPKL